MTSLVQLILGGYFSKTTTLYHPLIFGAILLVGTVEFALSERRRAKHLREASFFLWATSLWFVLTVAHGAALAVGTAPATVAYWWFTPNLLAIFFLAAGAQLDLGAEVTKKVVWFLLGYAALGVFDVPLVLARSLPEPLRFGYTFLGSFVVGVGIIVVWFKHAPGRREMPHDTPGDVRGNDEGGVE